MQRFKLIYIFTIILIINSSCSIDKRLHRPGYNVQWKKSKNELETNDAAKNERFRSIDKNEEINSLKKTSINKDKVNLPIKENYSKLVRHVDTLVKKRAMPDYSYNFVSEKIVSKAKSQVDRGVEEKNIYNFTQQESMNQQSANLLTIIGWVSIVLGLIVLLLISIIIGLFMMLLGLILIISVPKSNRNKDKFDIKYQDVVYLKNGSIIRGVVIEQVPNVSLKIQTVDGNVFVFKMDEVLKITKEQSR